ncbi:hypothetical protein ACFZDK_35465 [Streptomyces sp. NPDC007901]|uniref:RraA family protein n=1 Tax=Streptomyces sp. NPDC007901 TaxID=3364785 RepID=UPI0036EA9207
MGRHHDRGRRHRGTAGTVIDGVPRDVSASLTQHYPLFTRGRFMRALSCAPGTWSSATRTVWSSYPPKP